MTGAANTYPITYVEMRQQGNIRHNGVAARKSLNGCGSRPLRAIVRPIRAYQLRAVDVDHLIWYVSGDSVLPKQVQQG